MKTRYNVLVHFNNGLTAAMGFIVRVPETAITMCRVHGVETTETVIIGNNEEYGNFVLLHERAS